MDLGIEEVSSELQRMRNLEDIGLFSFNKRVVTLEENEIQLQARQCAG